MSIFQASIASVQDLDAFIDAASWSRDLIKDMGCTDTSIMQVAVGGDQVGLIESHLIGGLWMRLSKVPPR